VRIANAPGHVPSLFALNQFAFRWQSDCLHTNCSGGLKLRHRIILGRLLSLAPFLLVTVACSGCGALGSGIGLAPEMDQLVGGAFSLLIGITALRLILRSERIGAGLEARNSRQSESQDILATRYARGEIGREEFLEKSRDVRETAR
jgi:uncharacterized membrane protein